MNPPGARTPDDDIQSAQPPTVVKAGGGIALAAGALALLVAVQTISGFHVSSGYKVYLLLVAVTGAATATCGLATMRARVWGAIGGTVSSSLLFLATSLWLVLSMFGGLVSLFALGAPFASLCAIVLSAISIGPSKRATEARTRLMESGLDLGI